MRCLLKPLKFIAQFTLHTHLHFDEDRLFQEWESFPQELSVSLKQTLLSLETLSSQDRQKRMEQLYSQTTSTILKSFQKFSQRGIEIEIRFRLKRNLETQVSRKQDLWLQQTPEEFINNKIWFLEDFLVSHEFWSIFK